VSEKELRRVVAKYAAARADRDDAIRRAAAGGMSLRKIGEIVGLSHTRIAQILRG
jgi:transposase-like protein